MSGTSPLQGDSDGDGCCNLTDNCPTTANPDQADTDNDGIGDVCDPENQLGAYQVFTQDFENGLGPNESVFGTFAINNTHPELNNGTQMMGHAVPYGDLGGAATPQPSYGFYDLTVDLTGFHDSLLLFDFSGGTEKTSMASMSSPLRQRLALRTASSFLPKYRSCSMER